MNQDFIFYGQCYIVSHFSFDYYVFINLPSSMAAALYMELFLSFISLFLPLSFGIIHNVTLYILLESRQKVKLLNSWRCASWVSTWLQLNSMGTLVLISPLLDKSLTVFIFLYSDNLIGEIVYHFCSFLFLL